MTVIRLGPFGGTKPAIRDPKALGPNDATVSLNHRPDGATLRPWKNPLTVATAPAGQKTISILPRDATTDAIYWLVWNTIVHAIRSFRADDTTKRTYFTGSGAPKVTDNILALAGGSYPSSYRDLGIPKPATVPIVTQITAGTGSDETRFYAYSYVSDWDEIGMPQVSAAVTCKPGAILSITNLADPPSGPGETRGINRIRIWRTVAGDTGSAFFFLRDISVASSTTDDARSVGEDTMPSKLWAMPPSNLKNLIGLWNGIMAGISGNAVRYCEPFKPYAWPVANETLCLDTPIALVTFQTTLLILTTGRPRAVEGDLPEAMRDTPIEFIAACVSAVSAVSLGHGACWATRDGLAYVGTAGPPRLLTAGIMLPEDWKALNPESMVGGQFRGLYVGFYDSGGGVMKGFVIDPLHPELGMFFLSAGYTAVHYDQLEGKLYVLSGTNIMLWNGDTTNMTVTHRSKAFRMERPTNLSFAEVIGGTFPCTFTSIADSRAPVTRTVTKKGQFRLPTGFLADQYQFEITTTNGEPVGAVIAETIQELAQS